MMEPSQDSAPSADAALTLHHLNSSSSLRVLWALEELADAHGLPFAVKQYRRQTGSAPPELRAVHPLGASPILVVEPVSGSAESERTVVTEARLILQYLAEHYSHGLWAPTHASDRHRNEYWQEFVGSTLTPKVVFVMLFDLIPPHVPWIARPLVWAFCNAIAKVHKQPLPRHFQLMEDALSEERPWFAGEKLGQADLLMAWPMDLAVQRGYFDASLYPKVADWQRRVYERPAYKRALVKGGSYDLVGFDW